jgi:hypothetical protein
MEKIAQNDEAYMSQHKVALKKATEVADEKSILTASTDNPFLGILKGTVKPNQNSLVKAFNMFNNYMTRFLIYEYMTARMGVMAAMGNGYITRKQGAALLGAVTTRMVLYGFLMNVLTSTMVGLFVDDEEEDDEKSLLQKFSQSAISGVTSLLIGRDFGNVTKTIVNYGIEKANEAYLEELRNGSYNQIEDQIAYTVIPVSDEAKAKKGLNDIVAQMAGPFSPALATANLIVKTAFGKEKKEKEAIEREEKVKYIRIPLEVLGNAGYVPFYKDVKRVVNAYIYKDLKNAEQTAKEKKAQEELAKPPYGLTMEEYKRYFPDEYEQRYGKDSEYRKSKEQENAIDKAKDEIRRKQLDEFYNYQPKKKKDGFGSKKFGEKGKKGGFGSKKFGEKD